MRALLPLLLPAFLLAAEPTPQPAWLGVQLDEVDEALTYHLGLKEDLGVMVGHVVPNAPGAAMGLHAFDVIVAVNGKPVYTPRALQTEVRSHKVGDTITLTVRRGATSTDLKGTLAARPPEAERPAFPHPGEGPGPRPRSGRLTQPDGSVMEWSVGEQPPVTSDDAKP
jgi:predicted metalloprotease with PDZ domain